MQRKSVFASLAFIAVATAASAQAPAAKIAGTRGDFLSSFGQVEAKFNQLATAFPADKYSYTPGKGVRSVCEVLVHIAAENYEMG